MEEERKTGAIQIRHTGERIVGKNNYCLKFKKKKETFAANTGEHRQGKLHYTDDWIAR